MLYRKLGFMSQCDFDWTTKYVLKDKYGTEYLVIRLPYNNGYAFYPKDNEKFIGYADTLESIEAKLRLSKK